MLLLARPQGRLGGPALGFPGEVLESEKYPEILFRPDRLEGKVAAAGKSSVKVHGMFGIHGVEREITVPDRPAKASGPYSRTAASASIFSSNVRTAAHIRLEIPPNARTQPYCNLVSKAGFVTLPS